MRKDGEIVTPLPAYAPTSPGSLDSSHSASAPHRRSPRRIVRKIIAASSAAVCAAGLAFGTAVPALDTSDVAPAGAVAPTNQRLFSTQGLDSSGTITALGTGAVGVDLSQYKQFGTETGLVSPELLTDTELRSPFDREWPLTDGFAYRTAPVAQFHDAQDFAAADGTPVRAIGSGIVIEAGYATDGCGFSAKVQHRVAGETLTSRYCHMQVGSHSLTVGDVVSSGDQLGRVGNTGLSFGSHLHLSLRLSGVPIDPLPFIQSKSVHTITPDGE